MWSFALKKLFQCIWNVLAVFIMSTCGCITCACRYRLWAMFWSQQQSGVKKLTVTSCKPTFSKSVAELFSEPPNTYRFCGWWRLCNSNISSLCHATFFCTESNLNFVCRGGRDLTKRRKWFSPYWFSCQYNQEARHSFLDFQVNGMYRLE